MNITVRRIASHTGLSTATVSRILNGKGAHRPETIARVKRVMSTLSRHTLPGIDHECVGIVLNCYCGFLSDTYNSTLLSGMVETLQQEEIYAQLIPLSNRQLTLEDAELLLEKFNLRGLIVQELGTLYKEAENLYKLPVPVIRVGSPCEEQSGNVVFVDHYRIGGNAAAYLWNLGFTRFGVVGISGDNGQKLRRDGFIDQIRRFGGNPDEIWTAFPHYITPENAISAAVDFVNLTSRPQTVFFTQGELLPKFLSQVRRSGISVPRELFLIAVEDANELSVLELPIATIAFPTRELGCTAARQITELIRRGTAAVEPPRQISCSFHVRVDPSCLISRDQLA